MSGTFDDTDDGDDVNDPEPEVPWRPVWEDAESEMEVAAAAAIPPWISPAAARPQRSAEPDPRALLAPLAAAEDALSRLDAASSGGGGLRRGSIPGWRSVCVWGGAHRTAATTAAATAAVRTSLTAGAAAPAPVCPVAAQV